MSIAITENRATVRAYDSYQAEQEALEREEACLRGEFLAAAYRGDVNAVATFAGTTTDWKNRLPGGGYGSRPQTVGEVLYDTLDCGKGNSFNQMAMQILCSAAKGVALQADAIELLEQMARKWASQNAGMA